MTTTQSARPIRRPSATALALALAVAGGLTALSGLLLAWLPPSPPVATWRFGEDRTVVRPFDRVPVSDAMRLQLDLPTAGYVYVVSFHHRQGTVAYFPTDYLDTDHEDASSGRMNHLAAGRHALPGTWEGKAQAWRVPDVENEAVSLCVVFSADPLSDLEDVLRSCMQVGNTAFADKSMGRYMPRGGKNTLLGRQQLPHGILRAATRQMDALVDGPMVALEGGRAGRRVFVKTLNIIPDKPRPGVTKPVNPLEQQLQEALRTKARPGR